MLSAFHYARLSWGGLDYAGSLQFPRYPGHKVLRAEYKRMLEIIQACHEHKEWVDSYTFLEKSGIFNP